MMGYGVRRRFPAPATPFFVPSLFPQPPATLYPPPRIPACLQEDIGLIPRICEGLFDRCLEQAGQQIRFSVEVSYLEIYNEKVKDLLIDSKASESKNLKVREHPQTGIWGVPL
jgi:hypothetical protein